MATLVVLTREPTGSADVLPSLTLLDHTVRAVPLAAESLVDPVGDVVVVDGRHELAAARAVCRVAHDTGLRLPILLVLTEGGLAAVTSAWGCSDVVLTTAGPAEVETRIRLLTGPAAQAPEHSADLLEAGELVVDVGSYTARVRDQVLNLTYKEFELLRHLAQHPGRVFTRVQLLDEVWGYDYYGGTRTVDVHIRRLRAKLGAEHDQLIGTVRNVGYRFVLRPTAD